MELAVRLPLMEFAGEGQSLARLTRTVDAARDCGFAAVSANDHFVFATPWLDGPTALAAVLERAGDMALATTVSLVALRGPVPVAKALAALDLLSDGRLIAGVGPGSSQGDLNAVGVPHEERWKRRLARVRVQHDSRPVPRREDSLAEELRARGRDPDRFPNALVTMWTCVRASGTGKIRRMGGTARRRREASFPIGASASLEELDQDPHPLLTRLREREPVSWLPALGGWVVVRRDLALQAMRDSATFTVDDPRFSTGQVVGPSMLTLDGAEHGRHRNAFAPPFRLDEVRKSFTPFVHAETERLIDAIEAGGRAELRRSLAGPLAATVAEHALGLEGTDSATILGWYEAIVDAVTGVAAGRPVPPGARKAFSALRSSVELTLDRHPRSSLVAAAASQTGGLTRAEVASNVGVLMFGGIETTEGMIANAILHLLAHPEQRALVERDRELLPNAVEESLRLEPAAASIDRYATRDVRLGAASIREGDLVTISIAGANRDPDLFPDPDRFDVRRENARHQLAFARGPHVCIGMHLARLEAHVAIARLLDRLPHLRLDPAHPAAPRGLVFRKPPSLQVVWG